MKPLDLKFWYRVSNALNMLSIEILWEHCTVNDDKNQLDQLVNSHTNGLNSPEMSERLQEVRSKL